MQRLFGLRPSGEGRMGADAVDEQGHKYELKSATLRGVATGRDVGRHTLQRYRTRYWIVCRGAMRAGTFDIAESYFLSPHMMEEWFSSIESRIMPDLELLDAVTALMKQTGFSIEKINRLEYLVRRGITLNNPKISWRYIERHGVKIESDHGTAIRRLVAAHPLRQESD